mgnify:CR=1 FL=1
MIKRLQEVPESIKVISDGQEFEVGRSSGSELNLKDNLKKLKAGKGTLFAKLKYLDPSRAQSSEVQDPDSIINEDEPETTSANQSRLIMLDEPLLGDCEIEFLDFGDDDAKMAFRHSSAHVLGYAIE